MCQCNRNVLIVFVIAGESNKLSAIFLIVNAALGAGLLNFPQAFDQAGGIFAAVAVQAVSIHVYHMSTKHSNKMCSGVWVCVCVYMNVYIYFSVRT